MCFFAGIILDVLLILRVALCETIEFSAETREQFDGHIFDPFNF